MKEVFAHATHYSVLLIDAMALLVIVAGTIEAFVNGLRVLLTAPGGHESRDVWLRYARWLVAGLTFQLAADILETSIAPSWDDIGRLAIIAVIRTFLNYFLERDLTDIRERQAAIAETTDDAPRRNPHHRLEVDHAQ
jgi:uncharacterized membrane protein